MHSINLKTISEKKISVLTLIRLFLILALVPIFCYFLPLLLADRPVIERISPSLVMENSSFNASNSITLTGRHFDHLTAIYLNGKWVPECTILSQSEDRIELTLPSEYWDEAAKLKVQLQIKLNSDLFCKSNAAVIDVLSDSDIPTPKIAEVTPSTLRFAGNITQQITLSGTGFTENSRITVDNTSLDTCYENGVLKTELPYSLWCSKERLSLMVVQYYDGYPTSVKSSQYYLFPENSFSFDFSEENTAETLAYNRQIFLNYLSALHKSNFLIIMAVKDESSCAVTDDIISSMKKLGLKSDLHKAGTHRSYIAIIDEHTVLHEEISQDSLYYDGTIDGTTLQVISQNFNADNFSSIRLNDAEYSLNQCGLNIVVYDKANQQLVDSVTFDTYADLSLKTRFQ